MASEFSEWLVNINVNWPYGQHCSKIICNSGMPFLHIYPNLSEEHTIEIMNENKELYITSKKDFLSIAKYAPIANHTIFRIFKTVAAHKLPRQLQ